MKLIATLCLLILGLCTSDELSAQHATYPFTVKTIGQGTQPIILIPGFGSSDEVWNETIQVLAQTYPCYKINMAGYGGTKPAPDPGFENWVQALAGFIRDNNIVKPIIIGHSMGGMMAMKLASEFPDIPLAIIDVDGYPKDDFEEVPASGTQNINCDGMVKFMKSLTDEQFTATVMKGMAANMIEDPTSIARVIEMAQNSDRETYARTYCELLTVDFRADLVNITCPVLVLSNAIIKDKYRARAEGLFKNLKQASIRYAPSGGHMLMWEDWDWYISSITTFLGTIK